MKLKIIKQNTSMSVYIAVIDTAQKMKIKLLNRQIGIENLLTENDIKNEIKIKMKYWHECQHCIRRHSTIRSRTGILTFASTLQ